jgi:hypothetical protein
MSGKLNTAELQATKAALLDTVERNLTKAADTGFVDAKNVSIAKAQVAMQAYRKIEAARE